MINCPLTPNPDQADANNNGVGDVCEDDTTDTDDDGIPDNGDNCPTVPNPDQADANNNGVGDVCEDDTTDTDDDGIPDNGDNCPLTPNPDQADANNNGVGDVCEDDTTDTDDDGIPDNGDNCPTVPNPDQADANNNGVGDVCEDDTTDTDDDGIPDNGDNCPTVPNPDQADANNNGVGDVCEDDTTDTDDDGIPDNGDNCPTVPNPDQADANNNGVGDVCEDDTTDTDDDGIPDNGDNCPLTPNPDQADANNNGVGDVCEDDTTDTDDDGIPDNGDNCPLTPNPDQADANNNGVGDVCEDDTTDTDDDGILDDADNCPTVPNPDQADDNNNGVGDACEIIVGGDHAGHNEWDTRPTFGVSHETRETILVDTGFEFNTQFLTVTDNHHTHFDEKSITLGTPNTFVAKVYADKGLKIQEFLFGVPQVGLGHLAEMRVEVWYGLDGQIEEVKVKQDSEVIDVSTLAITHQKSKCIDTDKEEKCDTTSMTATFKESLLNPVMAIKAIDQKARGQTTYLNDGFDISGDSLNPMNSKLIPSLIKGEGLIEITQNKKYGNYWSAQDGRIFEMNSFGSFKQVNQSFERFQDSGNVFSRQHSDFGKIINYEQNRAVKIFDSSKLIAELPDSFGHHIEITERIDDEMKRQMLLQEQKAQELLDAKYVQTHW